MRGEREQLIVCPFVALTARICSRLDEGMRYVVSRYHALNAARPMNTLETPAYFAAKLEESGLLKLLAPFDVRWVGTIPIDVHIEGSDIDLICHLHERLADVVMTHFREMPDFSMLADESRLVARFVRDHVAYEIYAEPKPTDQQNGFRHMMSEQRLLSLYGEPLRREVRRLKRTGVKTEPAFAQALGLRGDPYELLLLS